LLDTSAPTPEGNE